MVRMVKPIAIPAYIQVVCREETEWHFCLPKRIIYAPVPHDTDFFTCREKQYGLTKAKIVLELRLLTGGKLGWYLVDMKHKQYYYCGEDWEDVRIQLQAMEIGRSERF